MSFNWQWSWAWIGGLILFTAVAAGGDSAGYRVVVHSGHSESSISRKDLSSIFLRQRTEWPDGTPAVPVDQLDTAHAREEFSTDVHGRSAAAIKSYWLRIIFSGRGVPPVEKASDADVIAFVRTRKGAIGYVSLDAPTSDVKVLKVTR